MTSPYYPPPAGAGPGQPWGSSSPYPPARASKAMAIVALILGIIGVIPIFALVAIGLGIAVLVRSRDGADRGRGLAIGGIVAAVLWLLVIGALVVIGLVAAPAQHATRASSGAITQAGTVAVTDLRAGDCYDDDTPAGGTTTAIKVEPCADAHDYEVYDLIEVPGQAYPGENKIKRAAQRHCALSFGAFVGTPVLKSKLTFYTFFPLPQTWALGEHEITCSVTDKGHPTTGTLKDSHR